MNYKNLAIRELKSFSEEFPDYTLGQILFSVFRQGLPLDTPIKELFHLKDEEIYTMLEKAKEVESE